MDAIHQLRKSLSACDKPEEMRDVFSHYIKELGYHGFDAYGFMTHTAENPDQVPNFLICDYDYGLIEKYMTHDWMRADPILDLVATRSAPFDYLKTLQSLQADTSITLQRSLLRLMRVRHAWCIPLSTSSMVRGVTVYMKGAGAVRARVFEETVFAVQLGSIELIDPLNNAYNRLPMAGIPDIDPSAFSQRERDCLAWVARGKTNWEISQILSISENTVRYHLKRAFRRLGVHSRSGATYRAVKAGVIEA